MPHIVVEYSANIEEALKLDALFEKLVYAAVGTGLFELAGIRVRGERRDRYRIADNHADNGFVHMTLRVGAGRPEAALKQAGDRIDAVLCEHLAAMFRARPLAVSMEIQEIHPALTWKKNNILEHMERRPIWAAE